MSLCARVCLCARMCLLVREGVDVCVCGVVVLCARECMRAYACAIGVGRVFRELSSFTGDRWRCLVMGRGVNYRHRVSAHSQTTSKHTYTAHTHTSVEPHLPRNCSPRRQPWYRRTLSLCLVDGRVCQETINAATRASDSTMRRWINVIGFPLAEGILTRAILSHWYIR